MFDCKWSKTWGSVSMTNQAAKTIAKESLESATMTYAERAQEIAAGFDNMDDYVTYFCKALSLLKPGDGAKKSTPLSKFVPDTEEVHWSASARATRLSYPRYDGIVRIELPNKDKPRSPAQQSKKRTEVLINFAGTARRMEDDFACRFAFILKAMDEKGTKKTSKKKKVR